MKVLQLIDSLRPGGAERMAVNLANALVPSLEGSYLCCTRFEGGLKQVLDPAVGYLFLEKKTSLDLKALQNLKRYIASNNIDIVHAHGTSYFLAVILKITGTKIKIVWHEHYGGRSLKKSYNFPILYTFSYFFDGIITVNLDLLKWVEENLNGNNKTFIPNFVPTHPSLDSQEDLLTKENYIVCLANLKIPKNHLNLLKAYLQVVNEFPGYKLYLIGKDYNDTYKTELEIFIKANDLNTKVVFKGELINNYSLLKNSKIGILSSDSEGLPMSLLEYGIAGIPVICTAVGLCENLVNGFGKVVPVGNDKALAHEIIDYLKNPALRINDGMRFYSHIEENYSSKKIIPEYYSFYNKLLL